MSGLRDMKVTPVFVRNWRVDPLKRWVVNRGGTRSSKTYSICQQVAVWLITGQFRENVRIEAGSVAVVRRYGTTLAKTVMRDFEVVLGDLGLLGMVDVNKTSKTFRVGRRFVEFVGADDEQKMRGFKATITWMNEANELDWDTQVMQLRFRTERYFIVDFNPSDPYIWIKDKLELERSEREGDVELIVSTYKDNPYLSRDQVGEIEQTRYETGDFWAVYGEGGYGLVKGLCFPRVSICKEMPPNVGKRGFGLDFGGMNGITALVECGVLNGGEVYLDCVLYQTGLLPKDLGRSMRGLGVDVRTPVAADSAGEFQIKELQDGGLRGVYGAKKGRDSVNFGIDLLNEYDLFLTERSVEMRKEQMKYRYKTDASGVVLPVPVDAYNHAWDAARYWAVDNLTSRRRTGWLSPP